MWSKTFNFELYNHVSSHWEFIFHSTSILIKSAFKSYVSQISSICDNFQWTIDKNHINCKYSTVNCKYVKCSDLGKPFPWCKIDILRHWCHVKAWIILFSELFTWIVYDNSVKSYLWSKAIKNKEKHSNYVVKFLYFAICATCEWSFQITLHTVNLHTLNHDEPLEYKLAELCIIRKYPPVCGMFDCL